jgi:ABC-2 type transport system ATP-binding protein
VMEPVIEILGLVKKYQEHFWSPQRTVLRGLDLSVQPGEIFGFLGPNGAGKTTTIKAIVGLIRPSAGTVRVFGGDPWITATKRRIGFLPESPYFYDYLTGREFLRFCGRLAGLDGKPLTDRIGSLLERIGMTGSADLQMRKYSKGMLQRIGLAQALINDPLLVVLDEPLTGLDPLGRADFKAIILELKQHGATVFFSSHVLPDAEAVCDRVAIISRGRLLRTGSLHELLRTRTRAIELSASGVGRDLFRQLADFAQSGRAIETGVVLQYPDQAAVARALELLRNSGAAVQSIVPRQESLEEYFAREVERDEQ